MDPGGSTTDKASTSDYSTSSTVSPVPKKRPVPRPRPRSTIIESDDDDASPPKLPPNKPTIHQHSRITQLLPEDRGPFTLTQFISKYGHSLPLCVSVERGYQSDDERYCIGMGDEYNIHFVKRSKVVILKDSSDVTYNIPLSSPMQFTPLFNTLSTDNETDCEQIFDCVADMVTLKPLPRLIRVTKNYMKDNELLVEKNEILLVQKVITSPLRKKSLKVYSVLHNREKILPSDCEGGFTTDHYATRLHLPDIISLFLKEFPLKVIVYLTDIELVDDNDFPFHLSSDISVLTDIQTEVSVVASTHWPDEKLVKTESVELIDIPIHLDIEVSILQTDMREKDLFKRTKTFLEAYNPAKVRSIRVSSSDLSTIMRPGHEREGVEIQEPNVDYDVIQSAKHTPSKPSMLQKSINSQHNPLRSTVQHLSPQQQPRLSPPVAKKPPHLQKQSQTSELNSTKEKRKGIPPLLCGQLSLDSAVSGEFGKKEFTSYHYTASVESQSSGKGSIYQTVNEACVQNEHVYQKLNKDSCSKKEPSYVTLTPTNTSQSWTGAMSKQIMLDNAKQSINTGDDTVAMGDDDATILNVEPSVIKQLIGRIEILEKQVASLTDKVQQLSKQ